MKLSEERLEEIDSLQAQLAHMTERHGKLREWIESIPCDCRNVHCLPAKSELCDRCLILETYADAYAYAYAYANAYAETLRDKLVEVSLETLRLAIEIKPAKEVGEK